MQFHKVIKLLKKEVKKYKTPVAELMELNNEDVFKVLISTMLSARTKDEVTLEASERLFEKVNEVNDLNHLTKNELMDLIYPVGFYKRKAEYLKKLPNFLENNEVPNTREELMKIPGVGRKTANIVLNSVFNKSVIPVDTHVHRITNRWGLVNTRTPLETEKSLMKKVPKKHWHDLNYLLVSFGQNTCKPISPRCEDCVVYDYCKRVGV